MSQVGSRSLRDLTEGRNSHRMEEAIGDRMTKEITALRGLAMAAARAIEALIGSSQEKETEVTKVGVVGAIVTIAPGSMGKEEITAECETITRGLQPGMGMGIAKIRTRGNHKEEAIEIGALTSVIDNKIRGISTKIKTTIDLDNTIMEVDIRVLKTKQGSETTLLISLGLAQSPLKDGEGTLQTTKTPKSKSRPNFKTLLIIDRTTCTKTFMQAWPCVLNVALPISKGPAMIASQRYLACSYMSKKFFSKERNRLSSSLKSTLTSMTNISD